jgi:RHS repeat-associated protein
VYSWDSQEWNYILEYTHRFVYDGWNLIAVLDENNAPVLSFAWGTDLSGTMQGAGGVGGLLSVTVHSGANAGTYFYCYDGNGNVVALVSAADGSVAARYEYGPFGELLRATGPMARVSPFLFSTKYYDWETGLYYYGYRYYDPSTGRWLSKDPLTEPGFVLLARPPVPRETQGRPDTNPYRFLHNDAINETDFLGLWYNIFTHCCCRGQLIPRKPVPSGIRFCDIKSDYGEYDHGWIEIDGFSAGFYAGDSIWGGTGHVDIPDYYAGRSYKRCRDILLSPCKYDLKVLKLQIINAIIADQANSGQYHWILANCYHWRSYMLNHFLATHKGCGDSMGSFE